MSPPSQSAGTNDGGVSWYRPAVDRRSWGILERRFSLEFLSHAVIELAQQLVQGGELLHATLPVHLLELSYARPELVQLALERSVCGVLGSAEHARPRSAGAFSV